ncbi:hypothetical protein QVM41_09615 [Pseudomonas shirazica]
MTVSAPMRSSAARAALRSTKLLLHLFQANYSCAWWVAALVHDWRWMKSSKATFDIEWNKQGGQR